MKAMMKVVYVISFFQSPQALFLTYFILHYLSVPPRIHTESRTIAGIVHQSILRAR